MNIGIITQARMTSTRLPGKIFLEAAGVPMLKYHTDRLLQTELPLFVATTTNQSDDQIVAFCEAEGIPCHRGSEDNVLSRFYHCARANALDVIIRVTSDCPLIDPDLILAGVDRYRANKEAQPYVSNCLNRTFPRGFDFEIFSFQALEEAFRAATLPGDLEHVTPYINQNRSGKVPLIHVTQDRDASNYRVTLDTPEDLELLTLLIEDHQAHTLSWSSIIELMDSHPELASLNAHIEQRLT